MSATAIPPKSVTVIHYPDDDGLPMSDNTRQMKWIFLLYGNLIGQYRNDPNIFVAGNHLIYPVEGDAKIRQAPDVYVAFGRPKQDRGSYKVWEEEGVFPQVVFEVWSPNNRYDEMQDKFKFYEKYGAEEYYILYPEFPMYAEAYRREGEKLVRIEEVNGYVSPRTGLRFALNKGQLTVFGGDGRPLRTVEEQAAEREAAERAAAEQQQRAEAESKRAEAAKEQAAKLAAKLRELGIDPDTV
ncbi:MAG: Uma2 family endonuclease [Planctomycetia bacterium]|nr:Uma2 family endonuclease [Planctomycetia bacterium]